MAPLVLPVQAKAVALLSLSLSCFQLVNASPAELQNRAICYQDNCLRELQHSSALASPFCSSYLDAATITLSTTVTVTITATTSGFLDTSITQFGKRSATSFSPISCTENPTAVSSGCSCLLTFPTATATATATATTTVAISLPSQCDASNNYGKISGGLGILDGPGESNHYWEYTESYLGACCVRCFATTNCVAFAEFDNADGEDLTVCIFWAVYEVGTTATPTAPANPTCPYGSVTISLSSPSPSAYLDGGVGPCGVGVVY